MAHIGGAALAEYRTKWMPKVWFLTYNMGACFFLPYINLFYRQLGFSEQQIGVLCALKPWVGAPAGNLVVSLADTWRAHFFVAVVTYLICLFGRGFIAITTGYAIQVALALLTEASAAPLGVVIDAAVMASSKDEGGYGRQRMWASVGWGGMSPLAGAVVARYGLKTAFAVYFVVVLLAFIPTLLLPISILSSQKGGGQGSGSSSGGDGVNREGRRGSKGAGARSGDAGHVEDEIQSDGATPSRPGSRAGSASGMWLSPQERRVRMDSNLASRAGSKQSLEEPPNPACSDWSISTLDAAGSSIPIAEKLGVLPPPPHLIPHAHGVLHLIADARRTPTEQLLEMADGQWAAALGSGVLEALPSGPNQSEAGGGLGPASLRQSKAALLTDDNESSDCPNVKPSPLPAAGAQVEDEHGSVWQGVRGLLCNVKVVTFLFLAFCMGIGNGCIGYLFLYLDELGATGSLMGLCLSFNCMAEVPVFYYSGPIIERLGVERAFSLGMAAYILRVLCYIALPLLPSVWWVLPVELLQGCTFALAWSSGCVYVKRIAPVWLRSTVQSIFQGLYAGIGAGLGGLVGGFLYGVFGAAVLFKTAAITLVMGLAAAMLGPHLAERLEGQRYHGYQQVGEQAEGTKDGS